LRPAARREIGDAKQYLGDASVATVISSDTRLRDRTKSRMRGAGCEGAIAEVLRRQMAFGWLVRDAR